MEVVFILVPVSLIILGIAIAIFFWAVKNDQFEDLEGPAHQILFDDKERKNVDRKDSNDAESGK
ncbi:MAG TPA: cbb3-type cytochrome oxidase assembly protein CcoS [Pseudomonadales bacterium]|nr:cbb3-type cytochrome oxidase assembly protein CcoS [Pseudomonadales bacterium]